MKLGVFIERDGILNQARVERQHQVSPLLLEEFKINAGVAPLLKQLKAAGFTIIVTTNQPGISRGYLMRRELDRMHDLLRRTLPIDDLLICAHDDMDHCPCRKPRPGLFTEAAHKMAVEPGSLVCRQRQMAGRGGGAGRRGHLVAGKIPVDRHGAP